MSEEIKTETPKVDQDQQTFQALQNQFLQLCAQAGEKKYLIGNLTKDLNKILRQLRITDKKARVILDLQKTKEEAKKATLKAVPPIEPPTAA